VIIQYGSYFTADHECTVIIDKEAVMNAAGQPYALRHTWSIEGMLNAADTAAVVVAMQALERAFAPWFFDLYLLDSSGNICHAMPSRGSLTGVKIIKPPHYPKGDGAELSTFRNYAITATADYPYGGGVNPLKAFTETLAFRGGGPRQTVVECVDVEPQPQLLNLFTAFRAVQTGSAIGMFGYPPIPPPIFPGALEEAGEPVFTSPSLMYGTYVDFGVSWSYRFSSPTPLVGLPNQWPAQG